MHFFPSTPPAVFESSLSGHRPGYLDYFTGELGGRACVKTLGMGQIVRSRLLVLSTADDYLARAVWITILRAIMGRSTIWVVIRAEYCVAPRSWKLRLKRRILQLVRRLRGCEVVGILPYAVCPGLDEVTTKWLYDPAFFARNLGEESATPVNEARFMDAVRSEAGPRPIVFLGALSEERGISDYAAFGQSLCQALSATRVIAAGKAVKWTPELESRLAASRALVYRQSLTERSFGELIGSAGVLWCAFGPKYDQSSGLFCNAIRVGKDCIVRKGSRIARLAVFLGLETAPVPGIESLELVRGDKSCLERCREWNEQILKRMIT